jgi:hypothetical protein
MTTTPNRFRTDTEHADVAPLVRCDKCGRHGWHETDRCTASQRDLSVPGATVDLPEKEGPAMPTTTIPDVPLPAGATKVGKWLNGDDVDPRPARCFTGDHWSIEWGHLDGEPVIVELGGEQCSDGEIVRYVCARVPSGEAYMTAEKARELAGVLVEAADQIDGWAR